MRPPAVAALVVLAASGGACTQASEPVTCGTHIVSSSVVSMYCGRRAGTDEMLELAVLWRGAPGWFQRPGGFGHGNSGHAISNIFGTSKGRVQHWASYGDVAIGIDADFDRGVVKIGDDVVAVSAGNVVFVDDVDAPGSRRIAQRQWIRPTLPANGDPLPLLAERSTAIRDYLRCNVPVPPRETPLRPGLQARVPKVGPLCEEIANGSSR